MEIKPESEVECTLIDPTRLIGWLGDGSLLGVFRGDGVRPVIVSYSKKCEVGNMFPPGSCLEQVARYVLIGGGLLNHEIISPDGKKVLVRRCVDGPTPTHLFIYDVAE